MGEGHYLTGLRDPEAVARGDRHYMYYPTRPRFPGVVAKHEQIGLDRQVGKPTDSVGFRMAEDLKDSHLSATLEFKVTGMVEGDEIEVVLNGKVIPVDRIERRHRADARLPPVPHAVGLAAGEVRRQRDPTAADEERGHGDTGGPGVRGAGAGQSGPVVILSSPFAPCLRAITPNVRFILRHSDVVDVQQCVMDALLDSFDSTPVPEVVFDLRNVIHD